jgi:hypothetical protein
VSKRASYPDAVPRETLVLWRNYWRRDFIAVKTVFIPTIRCPAVKVKRTLFL